jgi:hypothetical protein
MRILCMTIVLTLWLASEVFAGGGVVQLFRLPDGTIAAVRGHQVHHGAFVQRVEFAPQPPQVNVQVRRGFLPRVFGPRVNVQINR